MDSFCFWPHPIFFWPFFSLFSTLLFLLAFALYILSDSPKKFDADYVSSLQIEP